MPDPASGGYIPGTALPGEHLVHSQFDALEEPRPDENPLIVSIEPEPREIVAQILSALRLSRSSPARASCPGIDCAGRANGPVGSRRGA